MNRPLNPHETIRIVCADCGVNKADLCNSSRFANAVLARGALAYIFRNWTHMSLADISHAIKGGDNHGGVHNTLNSIAGGKYDKRTKNIVGFDTLEEYASSVVEKVKEQQ